MIILTMGVATTGKDMAEAGAPAVLALAEGEVDTINMITTTTTWAGGMGVPHFARLVGAEDVEEVVEVAEEGSLIVGGEEEREGDSIIITIPQGSIHSWIVMVGEVVVGMDGATTLFHRIDLLLGDQAVLSQRTIQ